MPKKRTPEELAKLKDEIEWDNYIRHAHQNQAAELERKRNPEAIPAKIKQGPNKTRSTYAWSKANRFPDKLVASSDTGPVEFLAERTPAMCDIKPTFSVKNILEYLVIKRTGRREVLAARGFTKCCAPSAYCQRQRCAKCWALKQKQVKGVEFVVREVVSGEAAKIVDPYGVDPKGKRSSGKDLDLETRSRFRLTSTQHSYRSGSAAWQEPD